ncbi:hypothetical protein M758_9G017400 [Ceratodon purpureus]|nr:hypothetical protein M758_9G017400 [Ceratodon purpureus]
MSPKLQLAALSRRWTSSIDRGLISACMELMLETRSMMVVEVAADFTRLVRSGGTRASSGGGSRANNTAGVVELSLSNNGFAERLISALVVLEFKYNVNKSRR